MTTHVASPSIERLAAYVLERPKDKRFAGELRTWLAGSARFRAFVESNRDKVRKKLRGAGDEQALLDVRSELAVARLLLADRRVQLSFEPYGSGRAGPDFGVSFRTARSFMLEVTRLRARPQAPDEIPALLAKLRQLPPSIANVVLLAVPGESASAVDVEVAVRTVRARADAKDEPFFAARGFASARGFYERFLRLGGVMVWCEAASSAAERATLWENRSARIGLPTAAARACLASLRAG